MARLPVIIDRPSDWLSERLAAEFLAHSLTLLAFPPRQEAAALDASVLRFDRPEPPRDPDLPTLPPRAYPRPSTAQIEAANHALQPPPILDGFVGRKVDVDQSVVSLLAERPVVITGSTGVGKTALLRQVAHDPRLRKHFKRIWWLDDLDQAGTLIGLALNAPNLLLAAPADQPRLVKQYVAEMGVLLLIDVPGNTPSDVEQALAFSPGPIAMTTSASINKALAARVTPVPLTGLTPEISAELLAQRSGQPVKTVQPLAALVDDHPLAIRLLSALLTEDGIAPAMLISFLRGIPTDRLRALYSGSFDAMPEDYKSLCRVFAASPRRWIAVSKIVERYDNPLVGQRALTFIERRGFIERRDDLVRAIGNWTEAVAPNNVGFEPAPRPADGFSIREDDDEIAVRSRGLQAQGLTLLNEGDDVYAERALQQALTLRQSSTLKYGIAETLTALARLAYLHGDDAGAIRHLETAAEHLHNLRDEDALEVIRLALSRVYRRAGRLDAALSVLGDDASPTDLVAVYRARQDWTNAIVVYKRWLERTADPTATTAIRFGLGETYLLAGRYADALSVAAGDAAFDKTFYASWLRGMVYHAQGETQKALDLYRQLHDDAPADCRAAFARLMARALAAVGEVQEAAQLVGAEGIWYEAKWLRPVFARQRFSQALFAHLNLMLGNLEEAQTAAQRVFSLPTERPDIEAEAIAYRVLGRIAWGRNQVEAALKAFENELAARGTLSHRDEHEIGVTLHNIGDLQSERGENDRAIANYRRSLSHKDANHDRHGLAILLISLRTLLLQVGRTADALEAGQQAVELSIRPPALDLRLVGYAITLQAQAQRDFGRLTRSIQALNEWIAHLSKRLDEGIAHPYWGVRLLATSLYLHSPGSASAGKADPIAVTDLAEKALDAAQKQTPDSSVAWAARRDLGEVYLSIQQWTEAREVFEALLHIRATDAPYIMLAARLGSAQAAVNLGQIRDAVRHFDAAAEYEPDPQARGSIFRQAGDAYRATDDDAHAAEYYLKAIELLKLGQSVALYVDTVVTLAYTRLRLRRFSEAIDTFEEALAIVEKSPDTDSALLASVLFDMATAHHMLGQYRRAADIYERSVSYQDMRRAPERYVETLIAIGRTSTAIEAFPTALKAYLDVLSTDLLTADQRRAILSEQAEVFARVGQAQTALLTYQAALDIPGVSALELATIHRGMGAIQTRLGQHDEARAHFEKVLAAVQDDQTGLTLQSLGDGHHAQGQLPEAIAVYQQALSHLDRAEMPVQHAAVERSLGEIYLEQHQATEAIKHLEIALDIERALPQQNGGRIVSTLQSLAAAHELRGERDRAAYRHHEALVYQDVRHAPDGYITTLRTLGRLYMTLGQYGEAAKAYDEALNAESRQPTPNAGKIDAINLALADVLRTWGRLEDSRDVYKRVSQSAENSPARQQARKTFAAVEAEIAQHLQTLEASAQSWNVLHRSAAKPDVTALAFVRALQARTCFALGRYQECDRYMTLMLQVLKEREADLSVDSANPAVQALALLFSGSEHTTAGDSGAAGEDYRRAAAIVERDPKSNASLVWAIHNKAGRMTER